MADFINYFYKLKENKPLLCVLFFTFYSLGLIAFYSQYRNIIFLFVGLFFALIFLFLKFKFKNLISSIFISSLFLLFLIGFFIAKINFVSIDDFSNIEFMKDVQLKGYIKTIPKFNPNSKLYKFEFEPDFSKINGVDYPIYNSRLLVSLKNNEEKIDNLKYGDYVSLSGILSTPKISSNPSEFNYQKFLNNKGILKTFYVKSENFKFIYSPDFKTINKKDNKIEYFNLCLIRKMHDIRDEVILKHSKYIKSPMLEILGGVVFGDDAVNPPDEIKGSFINSGLLHLLAASGLNVALILSMWLCFVYFINIPYRFKILSGIFIIFLYTLMTGFPPSIVRASVMLLLILIGKLIYRDANGVSLIFVAGLLILFFKPEFILDVGFQLSFLVTLGLIVCIPCVTHLFSNLNKNYLRKIKNFPKIIKSFLLIFSPISILCCLLVPFVAQLWAGPLQAYYFNTVSSYSILANIAVVPFIGIVSFLGFISTAFCFIPFISDIFLPIFDFILNFIIQIVLFVSNFFSSLPNSILKVSSPSVVSICLFYMFIILFFFSIKSKFKNKKFALSLIFSFLFLICSFIKFEDKNLEIIFFNVGNADNCLIKTVDNKYIMIDSGKYIYNGLSTAKTITLEYFYDNSIKELDTLIITHYDADHSGGLIDILDNIKVNNLIIPKLECSSKNTCEIKKYIEKNNIDYKLPYLNQKILIDNNTELINFIPITDKKNSRNESSVISLLKFNDFKILFMADSNINSFYSIKNYLSYDIDILKASHHGAKDTINFNILNILKPEYSVILTGPNVYGHPDIETINLLGKYSTVLSTDKYGAIKFKLKDKIIPYYFDNKKNRFLKIN